MDDAFASDLRGQLSRLFQNRISISDFRQWFMRAWWSAEDASSDSIFRLGARIENLLYILDSGEWSDEMFLSALNQETKAFRAMSSNVTLDPSMRREPMATTASSGAMYVFQLSPLTKNIVDRFVRRETGSAASGRVIPAQP
jgi:hypothetical protein